LGARSGSLSIKGSGLNFDIAKEVRAAFAIELNGD
jgi:hypothetical protein